MEKRTREGMVSITKTVVAYGGAPIGPQLRDLEKGADILAVVLNKAGVSL